MKNLSRIQRFILFVFILFIAWLIVSYSFGLTPPTADRVPLVIQNIFKGMSNNAVYATNHGFVNYGTDITGPFGPSNMFNSN